MAMAGKDIPQMLNEITPHREAKLSPKRGLGRAEIISTPKPCEASTIKMSNSSMVGMPQWQGKANTP